MQSDQSLRHFIQDELEEEIDPEDEQFSGRRPDFVCATRDNHLVISEIKRPSHKLEREDVQQLETYLFLRTIIRVQSLSQYMGIFLEKPLTGWLAEPLIITIASKF